MEHAIACKVADWLEKVYRCPRRECSHLFLASFNRIGSTPDSAGLFRLTRCVPKTPEAPPFPKSIQDISKDFYEIYAEASSAEQLGLMLISGPGYRKALEFLIKDYLCRIHSDLAEKIQDTQLSRCIKDFVQNPQVVAVASRAAWLGNDETHYVRKWEGKDLQDLKKLIALTVHWIELEETTKQLMEDMSEQAQKRAPAAAPKVPVSGNGS